jgi:hypothetical protein
MHAQPWVGLGDFDAALLTCGEMLSEGRDVGWV